MAYRSRKSSGGRRSYSRSRTTRGRRSYGGRGRTKTAARRSAGSTVRIVIEQHPGNAVARPVLSNGSLMRSAATKVARF